jgi:hypothetical protein
MLTTKDINMQKITNSTASQQYSHSINSGLIEINRLINHAVRKVGPVIEKATNANYLNFLNMMYHYTIVSEEQLRRAADPYVSDDLCTYYAQMSKDECGHFLLARNDLRYLGYAPHPDTPLIVTQYNAHWSNFDVGQTLGYLAACAYIENAVCGLEPHASALIRRLDLKPACTTWLRVHFEVDVVHGELSMECAKRHMTPDTIDLMINGANRDCALWVELFQQAFSGEIDLPRLG